uniref:Uncharacterized protein n=1 Tax=Anguilla anguilla TaxID=7936 RepID=A0A0E9W775_ANGAN
MVVFLLRKGTGPEGVFQLSEDHTPQPPRGSLCQGAGQEAMTDSQTPDSGETMWVSSRLWSSRPAFYSLADF